MPGKQPEDLREAEAFAIAQKGIEAGVVSVDETGIVASKIALDSCSAHRAPLSTRWANRQKEKGLAVSARPFETGWWA